MPLLMPGAQQLVDFAKNQIGQLIIVVNQTDIDDGAELQEALLRYPAGIATGN